MSSRAKRWTRAQARDVVDELEASGLSMVEFGRQRGLSPERIRKWRARFRREAAEAGPRMVELVARREAPGVRVQVHCPSGHRVEIVDVELSVGLSAALKAVAEVTGC